MKANIEQTLMHIQGTSMQSFDSGHLKISLAVIVCC